MEEKIISSTVRLDPEFHEEIRVAIARRRLKSFQQAVEAALRVAIARRRLKSFQQAVEAALRAWLDADRPRPQLVEASPAPAGATKEEQAQVARFLDFLRTGDPGQVELVTHALDLHQKKQRRLRKPG